METVTLNERLREDFSPLLKLLRAPFAVSTLCSLKPLVSPAESPSLAGSIDRYAQHCRLMLWRLNSYQYGSASAFLLDLEQLERAADCDEQKTQVQRLRSRLAVSEGEKQNQESLGTAYSSGGVTVTLRSSSGVSGLQQVAAIEGEEGETSWLCNVTLEDQTVTVGTFETQEQARDGYAEQVKRMASSADGFANLLRLGDQVAAAQKEQDKRVLEEAVAMCHPRLTSMKAPTVASSAPAAASATAPPRALPRLASKSLIAASSPVPSPAPSEVASSPPRHALRSTSSNKRQKVETASSSATSASAGSYLRLRRLIQKRLCRHLKTKEVCALLNPETQIDTSLQPAGRLEAGKVYSYRHKKQMTFAAFVQDELGRPVSACAHMFLVQERASIDDHLKVCDAFSDKQRDPPGVRAHAQIATGKLRKSSRRAH